MNFQFETKRFSRHGEIPWGKLIRGVGRGVLTLDDVLAHMVWPPSPGRLVGIPPGAEEVTISFPGIGSRGGANQARQAEKILPRPSAYFVQSSRGTTTGEMADLLVSTAPNLKRLHVNGHSMGFPSGIKVAVLARRRGLEQLKLGQMVAHGSPFDLSDGHHGTISRALDVVNWPTGPINKFGFQLMRELLDGKSPKAAFRQAKIDAVTGCTTEQWLKQRRDLQETRLPTLARELADMVDEDSRVDYCMPENPDMDMSVKTVQAVGKYEPFFEGLGVPFVIHEIPGMAHAEVDLACGHLAMTRQIELAA